MEALRNLKADLQDKIPGTTYRVGLSFLGMGQVTVKSPRKTRSRHNYGPAVFASSQHGPCRKSTTFTGFLFSLWKTIIHFRWYLFAWLWGYEFAVLPMFSIHVQHTRLKKGLFVSQHVEAKSASFFNVFASPQPPRAAEHHQRNMNVNIQPHPTTTPWAAEHHQRNMNVNIPPHPNPCSKQTYSTGPYLGREQKQRHCNGNVFANRRQWI